MRFRILSTLFCVFAFVVPVLAQSPAHESTIDGRWEAKVTTPRGEQVTQFEFKNAGGEVSGTVTEGATQPSTIKNGRLDGTKLTFSTVLSSRGDGDPIVMSWTGTIIGAGESIKLVRTVAGGSRGPQELEARRVQ